VSKGNKIVIGLLIFIIIGIGTVLTLNEMEIIQLCRCKCNNNSTNNVEVKKDISSELELELQKRYEEIYAALGEGSNVNISTNQVSPYDGFVFYDYNFDELKKYFSDNGINYIKNHMSYKKQVGDEIVYYENSFMTSIFGQTDQDVRKLKLVSYTDDSALLLSLEGQVCNEDKSLCVGNKYGNEYIMFKKVNNIWLVDFFE
jgi:hypothetical protein